ncbi:MAG: molybdopterin converting factor subunit 1 [Sutterellaceae bacterium]|nr:molybdopterin converting factor subunit 1 [Sutterellaceae bacterium]
MKITVKYFALLREAVGVSEEVVDLPESSATVADLRAYLSAKDEAHKVAFDSVKRIRAAVNATMVKDTAAIADNDEVAFFPPVTGG